MTTSTGVYSHPPNQMSGIESLESRQIFINDISGDTTTSDLRTLFAGAGKVTNVEIDTNELNRHFAFVTFETSQGVNTAISKFTTANLKNTTLVVRKRIELEEMRQQRMKDGRCKLFVGNIPQQMAPFELRREIQKLSKRPIADFRHKRGYCFVGYSNPQDAEDAKRNLKNAVCGGKALNAEFKKEDPIRNEPGFIAVLEQAQRTLYVRDIPPNCSPDYFKQIFETYGKVRKLTLPTEQASNRLTGYAFIEYFWKEDCNKALTQTGNLQIDGVKIEIRISDPPKQSNKDEHRRGGGRRSDRRDGGHRHGGRDRGGGGRDGRNRERGGRHSKFSRNRSRSRSRSRSRDRGYGQSHARGYGGGGGVHSNSYSNGGRSGGRSSYNAPVSSYGLSHHQQHSHSAQQHPIYNRYTSHTQPMHQQHSTMNPYGAPPPHPHHAPITNAAILYNTPNNTYNPSIPNSATNPQTSTLPTPNTTLPTTSATANPNPNPYAQYSYAATNAYAYPYARAPQQQALPQQPIQTTTAQSNATPQTTATTQNPATNTITPQQQYTPYTHPQQTQIQPINYYQPPQTQQTQQNAINAQQRSPPQRNATNSNATPQTNSNDTNSTIQPQTANTNATAVQYSYYNPAQPTGGGGYPANYYQQSQIPNTNSVQQPQQQQPQKPQNSYSYPQQTRRY